MSALLLDQLPLDIFLLFTSLLFIIGFSGIILNKQNIINILFSLEIMLIAITLNFIAFAHINNNITGQIFAIFIMTVAAAEAAIGLAIIMLLFRNRRSIDLEKTSDLRD